MPHNHRGMPISPNYRPTPRIAQMLATRVNRTSDYAPGSKDAYTEQEAQRYIDEYRDVRDYPRNEQSASVAEAMKAPIEDAIKSPRR